MEQWLFFCPENRKGTPQNPSSMVSTAEIEVQQSITVRRRQYKKEREYRSIIYSDDFTALPFTFTDYPPFLRSILC